MLSAGAALGAAGLGLGLSNRAAAEAPASMRPQVGDQVVHRFGSNAGMPVKPADVPAGPELIAALAKDKASGTLRDGSRLNGLNLVRMKAGSMPADLAQFAAGDVVAFSSVCTHQGCDLTQWHDQETAFECFCHGSKFNAAKMGEPFHGPALRSLAILPLALDDQGQLTVAAPFKGKVGFKA